MYETIHSLIVSDGKGGAKEIAPGQPYSCDPKEAERLLRVGAIKALEQPAEVAEKAPAAKPRRAKKEEAPAAPQGGEPEGGEPDFG